MTPLVVTIEELSTGLRRIHVIPALPIVIGRDPDIADLIVARPCISRVHAELAIDGEHLLYTDHGARNATLVNGTLANLETEAELRLKIDDVLILGGDIRITFSWLVPQQVDTGPDPFAIEQVPPGTASLPPDPTRSVSRDELRAIVQTSQRPAGDLALDRERTRVLPPDFSASPQAPPAPADGVPEARALESLLVSMSDVRTAASAPLQEPGTKGHARPPIMFVGGTKPLPPDLAETLALRSEPRMSPPIVPEAVADGTKLLPPDHVFSRAERADPGALARGVRRPIRARNASAPSRLATGPAETAVPTWARYAAYAVGGAIVAVIAILLVLRAF